MTDPIALQYLANLAVKHLLEQTSVLVAHPAGWQRPTNWPLPIKRGTPDETGVVRQNYRPLALLEYVHETLSRNEGEPA